MAPSSALDWSEPCQYWRYAKFCPGGQQQKGSERSKSKSATDVTGDETGSTYKRICKFLRRLGSKKREYDGVVQILRQRTGSALDSERIERELRMSVELKAEKKKLSGWSGRKG